MYNTLQSLQEKDTPAKLGFVGRLRKAFGDDLLIAIFAGYHLLKGLNHQMLERCNEYLYQGYHLDSAAVQTTANIAGPTFAIKPFIGIVSDLYPIFGYRKAPYMFIVSVIGVACYLSLGADASYQLPVKVAIAMIFGMHVQGAVCELLTEAQYSEKVAEHPNEGPDLVTFVWFGWSVMAIVANIIVPPLLNNFGVHATYTVMAISASILFWPLLRNYLGERTYTAEEGEEVRSRLMQNWQLLIPSSTMLVIGFVWMFIGFSNFTPTHKLYVSLVFVFIQCCANYLTLRRDIANVAVFFLLYGMATPSLDGSTFYFYNDNASLYPDGPHFDKTFYVTVLNILGDVFNVCGMAMYAMFLKKWKYSSTLYFCQIILAVGHLLDAAQFKRLNLGLGIDDHVMILGARTTITLVGRVSIITQTLLMSRMCPPGFEGTLFAILQGGNNMGHSVAHILGGALFEQSGVLPNGTETDANKFKNLWILAVIEALLPLASMLLVPLLIPDAKQTELLTHEHHESPIAGSFFARWSRAPHTDRSIGAAA